MIFAKQIVLMKNITEQQIITLHVNGYQVGT